MHPVLRDCTCEEAYCCGLPPEFVRLRYYFGQRLGVVDFADEQAYHAGKQRFHNLRAHGVGVLCGLCADRFVFPQNAPPDTRATVLRVARGVALDACGREIVVGGDQCLDVAAWYHKNRSRPEITAWTAPPAAGAERPEPRVWVAVRYRECPSDPGLAPRDPCGCDEGGCEFGRVREAFELALLTSSERQCCVDTFPARESLGKLLRDIKPAAPDWSAYKSLLPALHLALVADCPHGREDSWLCLASFKLTFEEVNSRFEVTDISEPDNAIAERESVLSSAALQELLLAVIAGGVEGGALGAGPRLGGLVFESAALDAGTLKLPVSLVPEAAASFTPLAETTFDVSYALVHRFQNDTWQDATPRSPSNISWEAGPPPHFRIQWPGGPDQPTLDAGLYRVTLESPLHTPIVDRKMRVLRPMRFARQFRLSADPTNSFLTLADVSF